MDCLGPEQRELHAVVQTEKGPTKFTDPLRHCFLENSGVCDGKIFHVFAIEDERYDPVLNCESFLARDVRDVAPLLSERKHGILAERNRLKRLASTTPQKLLD
jgi:hypothetical protein